MFTGSVNKEDFRYERKFFISDLTKHEIESLIRLHPAMFVEIFYERFVNNIYFDSVNLKNYSDNVDGNFNRIKIRIRWYGELFGSIEKPVLELKIKNGLLGRKVSYPLCPFILDNDFNADATSTLINKSEIPEILKLNLQSSIPTLLNCYSRKYFQSTDRNYRITIDTNQVFYEIGLHNNAFLRRISDNINVILELKYDRHQEDNSNIITNYFPFRVTKSSKYVNGFRNNFCFL